MKLIDFVITWVNGQDPAWQEEKAKYQEEDNDGDKRTLRYRDWNNLQYLFRGIESFAPWVNKVFLVTWGHLPKWLNLNHPKLKIVKHEDYIPKEYLPTFSSRTIDMNFHRISSLSEQFVYFNDDMFLISDVKREDFFRGGLPCDTAVLNAICPGYRDAINNTRTNSNELFTAPIFDMLPINRNFNKKESIKRNLSKWFNYRYIKDSFRTVLLWPWRAFPGFMNYHLPYSYLKSTYEEVWEKEYELLDQTCRHKFRGNTDVNHWVFTYWQYAKGDFAPRNPDIGKLYGIYSDPNKNLDAIQSIEKQRYKLVCLNDYVDYGNFESVRDQINRSLASVLPNRSSFEV